VKSFWDPEVQENKKEVFPQNSKFADEKEENAKYNQRNLSE